MTDVLDSDPFVTTEGDVIDDEPATPAEDPQPSGMRLDDLYIATYLKLEPVFTGWTREPRAAIAMRQKAADVALNIVAFSTRGN